MNNQWWEVRLVYNLIIVCEALTTSLIYPNLDDLKKIYLNLKTIQHLQKKYSFVYDDEYTGYGSKDGLITHLRFWEISKPINIKDYKVL